MTDKKSVTIRLDEDPSTGRKGLIIFVVSILLGAGILGGLYLKRSKEAKDVVVVEDVVAEPLSVVEAVVDEESVIDASKLEAVAIEPLENTSSLVDTVVIEEAVAETAIAVEMPEPVTVEVMEMGAETLPRISDFLETIESVVTPLIEEAGQDQELTSIDAVRLQLAALEGEGRVSREAILQDRLAELLAEFGIDALRADAELRAERYLAVGLNNYAAYEWSIYQKLMEVAMDQAEAKELYASLMSYQEAIDALVVFATAVKKTVLKVATQAEAAGDLDVARSEYFRLLELDDGNAQAVRFLNYHAYAAGEPLVGIAGMRFAFIPAGEFVMGTPEDEYGREPDELLRSVELTSAFYIGVTEVTQGQWIEVMGSLPAEFDGATGSTLPVHSISWHEADAFCRALSDLDPDASYRLPTEAEWEYACRAGNGAAFNFGTKLLNLKQANVFDPASSENLDAVAAVGSYAANAWGLYDMHGNVWEWVSDWKLPYDASKLVDPVSAGGNVDAGKALRGGSYYDEATSARSGNRWEYAPSVATGYIGLRVVRSVDF